jgi:hypothetical protein
MKAPFPLRPIVGDWLPVPRVRAKKLERSRRVREEREVEGFRAELLDFLEALQRFVSDYGSKDDRRRFHANRLMTIAQNERGTYSKKSCTADLESLRLLILRVGSRKSAGAIMESAGASTITLSRDESGTFQNERDSDGLSASPDSPGTNSQIVSPTPVPAANDGEQMLEGKEAVNYRRAAAYLDLSERQIRSLAKMGKLESRGQGHLKRITTASLRSYKGVNPPAEDQNQQKRQKTEQNGSSRK